jgi:hypothetical protein
MITASCIKEAVVQLLFLPAYLIQEVLIATGLFEYCLPPAIFLCSAQPVFLHLYLNTYRPECLHR